MVAGDLLQVAIVIAIDTGVTDMQMWAVVDLSTRPLKVVSMPRAES
jgi:hypothetical protein